MLQILTEPNDGFGRADPAATLAHLIEAGLRRNPLTYELIYHYPPARTFDPVRPQEFVKQLSALRLQDFILYVHIPFANSRCSFCHYVCHTLPSEDRLAGYFTALARELAFYGSYAAKCNIRLRAIHIGGGTPTAVPAAFLKGLFRTISALFESHQAAEVCIEASPETICANGELLPLLKDLGVTRISLGIQSFDDAVLRTAHRAHDGEAALRAISEVARTGFSDQNLDIIYGLPGQTMASWVRTLEIACQAPVNSVCAYQNRIAPRARGSHSGHFDEITLLKMFQVAERYLTAAGYEAVQPNQWIRRTGHFHAYVRSKWHEFTPMIGVGSSAYSSLPFGTFVNTRFVDEYVDRLTTLEPTLPPTQLGRWFDERHRMAQRFVLGWRSLQRPTDFAPLRQAYPDHIHELDCYEEIFLNLCRNRVFENRDGSFWPTSLALYRADEISTRFYSETDRSILVERGAGPYGAYLPWPPPPEERRQHV